MTQKSSQEMILLTTDRAARAATLALRLSAVGELDLRGARRLSKKLHAKHPELSCFDLAWLMVARCSLRDGRSGPLVPDPDPKAYPGRPVAYGGPALRGRPPIARNSISAVLIMARRRARYTRNLLQALTGLDITGLERSQAAPLEVLEPGGEILRRTLHLSDAQLCNAELGTWLDEEMKVTASPGSRRQLPLFE